MNSVFKKKIVTAINDQRIKCAKYMVMGYANKSFVELRDWMYVQYEKITPGDLMWNQENMKSMYNINELIEILLDQMEMGQESTISGNSPFSDRQLADMGVAKILATQEYTHANSMWKSIAANDRTWVRFKKNFQEANLDRKNLKKR